MRYKVDDDAHANLQHEIGPLSALTRYFFDAVYAPRSAWSVLSWWESRRLTYNLAVGAAGLVTVGVVNLMGLIPVLGPPRPPGFPWEGAVVYALAANLAYSCGPAVDLLVRRLWGHSYAAVGPALFRYGFVFAVGLTLLPIPVILVAAVVRVLFGW